MAPNNGHGRGDSLIQNILLGRSEFIRGLLDPRRSIDDECGYPGFINSELYQTLYEREPISTRVVQVLPRESWQVTPSVYEVEDADTKTLFEQSWDSLAQSLRGQSWFQDECGSPIWESLLRADILSGIGHYGVLLLGLDDSSALDQPARPAPARRLLYLTPLPEALAPITRYDTNQASPRFGQPTEYSVTINDPRIQPVDGTTQATSTVRVHHSRVLHLADNIGASTVFGSPRMEQVLNRLLDLRKLYGGSAEMYWRGALPGWSFETHPSLGGDVQIDRASLLDQFENYGNGLQRYLALVGLTAKSLAPQVVDPTPQIAVQLEAICIRLGIPMRIFKGSERGELASSQDDSTWNDRLRERQTNYLTPRVVVPFVDRLIGLGVLPRPKGYSVWWPCLDSSTDQDKAAIAVQRTNALATYLKGGVSALMGPAEFLTMVMGLTQAEAKAVIDSAGKAN